MTNEKDARKALHDLLKAIDQIAEPGWHAAPGDTEGAYWAHGAIPRDVIDAAREAERIAVVDFDHSYSLGVEDCVAYFGVGEAPDGWYLSMAYDVGHDCGPLAQDDGPYTTEGAALAVGLERAAEMMYDNDIYRGWKTEYLRLKREFKAMARKETRRRA